MADDWEARCEEILAATERDLLAAVGDSSLCAISKSGDRVDGVKYLEGRSVALREFRRALKVDDGVSAHRRALDQWEAQLGVARDRDMGPDWIAYRVGGVDALVELGEAFN